MDPFDWHHLLTPLTLIASSFHCLAGLALKQEFRSERLKSVSALGYSGCLLGWLMMTIGISLTSMYWLVKISILGWLIWLPSLILITFCLLNRLSHPKGHFYPAAIKITSTLFLMLGISLKVLGVGLAIALQFFLRRPNHKLVDDNDELKTTQDNFGGPYIFTKPPKNILGEGNAFPILDPLSPWYSSK